MRSVALSRWGLRVPEVPDVVVDALREHFLFQRLSGGGILANRSLSRVLEAGWPRTLEELEG